MTNIDWGLVLLRAIWIVSGLGVAVLLINTVVWIITGVSYIDQL